MEFACSICGYTSLKKENITKHFNRKRSCGPGTKEIVDGGIEGIKNLDDFDALIDASYAELHSEQIKRPAFKSRMDKISKMIEEATGIGEDCADALLLGEAHVQAIRINENNQNS